jgi:hypothetical protein
VIRGGSYDLNANYLQVGDRLYNVPYSANFEGFRFARTN